MIEAQKDLHVSQILDPILRSKATKKLPVFVGDCMQFYGKIGNEIWRNWFDLKTCFCFDKIAKTFTVTGKTEDRTRTLTLEDTCILNPDGKSYT